MFTGTTVQKPCRVDPLYATAGLQTAFQRLLERIPLLHSHHPIERRRMGNKTSESIGGIKHGMGLLLAPCEARWQKIAEVLINIGGFWTTYRGRA